MISILRNHALAMLRRRWFVRILQGGAFLGAAFAIATAILAYRYELSFSESAKALCRILTDAAIRAGVSLYDPCKPRLAELGPGSDSAEVADDIVRAEDFLQRRANQDAAWPWRFQGVSIQNETIRRSPFRFSYQPYDEPRLHQLRSKYRLDEVIDGACYEFDRMVRLRSWTRSQFRRKDYQPLTANFDALEILDRNHRNVNDEPFDPGKYFDPCHFFPLLYCQVMVSMGHTARLMSINHGMAEVWSNQWKKWVAMDVELDWHYEKNGIPLSMMEMRDDNFKPKPSMVRIVRGNQFSGDANTSMVHLKVESVPAASMIKYHLNNLNIVELRDDWLTNHYFFGHPARSAKNTLTFDDDRLSDSKQYRTNGLYRLLCSTTRNRDDMYWTLNQTEIWVRESSQADSLDLVFKTVTPNFDTFEIRIDDGETIRSPTNAFTWRLHEGKNSILVVSRNQFGIRGIPSEIKLSLQPVRTSSKNEL